MRIVELQLKCFRGVKDGPSASAVNRSSLSNFIVQNLALCHLRPVEK